MAYKNGIKQCGGHTYRQHTSLKNYIRKRDNYTCQICGEYGDQVDHIVPHAISNDSYITNLRVLCRRCNLSLRRKQINARLPLAEYYAQLENELKNNTTLQ